MHKIEGFYRKVEQEVFFFSKIQDQGLFKVRSPSLRRKNRGSYANDLTKYVKNQVDWLKIPLQGEADSASRLGI